MIEAWDDATVADAIGGAKTPTGAIRNVAKALAPLAERDAEARAEFEQARQEMVDADPEATPKKPKRKQHELVFERRHVPEQADDAPTVVLALWDVSRSGEKLGELRNQHTRRRARRRRRDHRLQARAGGLRLYPAGRDTPRCGGAEEAGGDLGRA